MKDVEEISIVVKNTFLLLLEILLNLFKLD